MAQGPQLAPMVTSLTAALCPPYHPHPLHRLSQRTTGQRPPDPSADLFQAQTSAKYSPSRWSILSGTFLSLLLYAHGFLKSFCSPRSNFVPSQICLPTRWDRAPPSQAAGQGMRLAAAGPAPRPPGRFCRRLARASHHTPPNQAVERRGQGKSQVLDSK